MHGAWGACRYTSGPVLGIFYFLCYSAPSPRVSMWCSDRAVLGYHGKAQPHACAWKSKAMEVDGHTEGGGVRILWQASTPRMGALGYHKVFREAYLTPKPDIKGGTTLQLRYPTCPNWNGNSAVEAALQQWASSAVDLYNPTSAPTDFELRSPSECSVHPPGALPHLRPSTPAERLPPQTTEWPRQQGSAGSLPLWSSLGSG